MEVSTRTKYIFFAFLASVVVVPFLIYLDKGQGRGFQDQVKVTLDYWYHLLELLGGALVGSLTLKASD